MMVFLFCSCFYDGGHCHDNALDVGFCLVMLAFYFLLNLRVLFIFFKV